MEESLERIDYKYFHMILENIISNRLADFEADIKKVLLKELEEYALKLVQDLIKNQVGNIANDSNDIHSDMGLSYSHIIEMLGE